MSEQSNANSQGIKVCEALDLYYQETDLPESTRDERCKRILDGLKTLHAQIGDITTGQCGLDIRLGDCYVEVYESGSEYYVDAAGFQYVMEQLRIEVEIALRGD